jgi:hypothetical protein
VEGGYQGLDVQVGGGRTVHSDRRPGYRVIPINASHPKMKSAWHVLDPEVMYWAPRQMQSIWDFGNRFGLIYVDFDTLERKPKLSAEWFREAARQNAAV